MTNSFKSGFITICGRPNVGKSTLMNLFLGEKVAIISQKPQTTRNKIQGILTEKEYQAIFIDTPGIHKPKSKLGTNLVKMAESAFNHVDVILFLTTPKLNRGQIDPLDREIGESLKKAKAPVFLVINKTDTISKPELLPVIEAFRELMDFAEIVPISALKADNTGALLNAVVSRLPEGPQYFPSDMATDMPERFIVAEMIREKALLSLDEEIPHGVAVEIESLKQREGSELIDINATIYCEKDSHKAIIIGKKGAKLKQIGTRARMDIEGLFSSKVNLQLWVKVKKDWRDSDFFIKNFGYSIK